MRKVIFYITDHVVDRAKRRHSCESRNPEKYWVFPYQLWVRISQSREKKIYNDYIGKYDNNRGFTLLEIIITFILAALVGSMLVEYMGSSLTRGGDAVVMVQDGFSLNSVMEKITADYEDKYKKGIMDFSTFKSNIEGGNVSTNTPYYGDYTVVTGYISFPVGGGEETPPSDDNLLKVTVTDKSRLLNNQSLTAIFRK